MYAVCEKSVSPRKTKSVHSALRESMCSKSKRRQKSPAVAGSGMVRAPSDRHARVQPLHQTDRVRARAHGADAAASDRAHALSDFVVDRGCGELGTLAARVASTWQVRNALRYVLLNAHKHDEALPSRSLDPCSSAAAFDGWGGRVVTSTHELARAATAVVVEGNAGGVR